MWGVLKGREVDAEVFFGFAGDGFASFFFGKVVIGISALVPGVSGDFGRSPEIEVVGMVSAQPSQVYIEKVRVLGNQDDIETVMTMFLKT